MKVKLFVNHALACRDDDGEMFGRAPGHHCVDGALLYGKHAVVWGDLPCDR